LTVGLFSKKRTSAVTHVGTARCEIDDAGNGYIRQSHHTALSDETVAALAVISYVLNFMYLYGEEDPAAAKMWIERILAYEDAAALTEDVTPSGVHPLDDSDHSYTPKAVAVGTFSALPSSELVGNWKYEGPFDPDFQDPLPILGVLLAAASTCGVDREVWHSVTALELIEDELDYSNLTQQVLLHQKLLNLGAEQSALDSFRGLFSSDDERE
jgi:hypothetical protein